MLKKFSVITLLGIAYNYNLLAQEIKYGYQLQPNQNLSLDGSQHNISAEADTKTLYGIYYSGSSKVELNADPLNMQVINNNTGTSADRYTASVININGQSTSAKPLIDLGDGGHLRVEGDHVYAINLKNSNLSASNINIEASSKYSATGLILNSADVNLTGNNKITIDCDDTTYGVSVSNKSSFKADQVTIDITSTGSGIYTVIGVNVRDNADQIVDLGVGSEINITSAKGGYGISINNGTVIAQDLSIISKGNTASGVVVYNGSFTMIGGTVISDDRGIVVGSVTPKPSNYNHTINLTDVNISATNAALNITEGTMTINRVTAVSASSSATVMAASTNGVINATDVTLHGKGKVVSASEGSVVFSGNTEIIGTASNNSDTLYASSGGTIKTGTNGSKMKIVGNLYTSQFGNNNLIDLKMNSGSELTGKANIYDINTGTINLDMTSSVWNMTNNSSTTLLALSNSQVNFVNSAFTTLTTQQLSGNGTFSMKTDIATAQGDLVKVTGQTAGSHRLNITNQGAAATDGNETLTVVETSDGKGRFSLTNRVEAGGYLYDLRKASNGTDWELYGARGVQSSSALAGVSFLNTSYLLNYIDNQTLLQRLGNLRLATADKVTDGLWMRSFGGKLSSFAGSNLSGFDMSYWGTQLGIDKNIELASGNLLLGTMVGVTQGNPNYKAGDGTAKNYSLGFYTTYLHNNGIYIDGLLKYNNIHNQFNVKDTAGDSVKGKGRTQGVSGSIEVGKRFWLSAQQAGVYIEPQAQLTLAIQGGDTVKASNGLKIKLDTYDSVLGRTGALIGYQIQGNNPIDVYFKTGYVREFSGNTSYRLNGSKEKHSFRGEWLDNGIGISANINKAHNIYVDINYAIGNRFDQKQLNLGYRYNF
ncbi:autotransporter outer membrane beta-barrel domain-containing protein [Entomomonas asaccharolytica]|uniref:Autotransporter outer membrane beta-barrel domain-containing protein n=1 Tax=Entomomonas asaccharolytica TaxID=2785331 RepID=A0A974NEQ1_9GAMM|nr:autotransporter outer membrane beta-barrel domain-containing protein [Entomomonas asaccharolytica]QQP85303.1 autotransporter outer membrane beta-barrel domain-containing protein [Entomomonas asaccharolytica]